MLTGILGAFTHQFDEDYSYLGFTNAQMGESRAELAFHLKNGNFGEYIMLRAQNFSPNIGYYNGNFNPNNNTTGLTISGPNAGAGFAASIPYFFAYGNFFDNKLKVSVGKLYDENFVTRERIWKTEGSTNGGFYFSREGYPSIRFQFMPIQGLDVGGQLFFVNTNASYIMDLGTKHAMAEMGYPYTIKNTNASFAESLKEWGLGASYTSSLFNAQAGVRIDSGVDPINKYEALTYLTDYYGDSGRTDPSSTTRWGGPNYKHLDKLWDDTTTDPRGPASGNAKAFADGTYAFFGFNIKAVKNLTFKVQGQFNNIPAFNEFGYGIFDETIGYQVLPKFYAGVVLLQQFYGGDVFDDAKFAVSPFLRFRPAVSYQVTSKITANLETTVGICKDVLETPWFDIKPSIDFALAGYGSMRAQIYYLYERADFADHKGINYDGKDHHKHEIGLGVDFMF
ncbi:MAG: hypothetical protein LBP20_11520 [Treponema sp.]|nr:hypothetical protein [Treponema sp.]